VPTPRVTGASLLFRFFSRAQSPRAPKGGADHRAVRAHPRFDACHRICVVLWAHSYEVWVDENKTEHRREVAWNKMARTAAKSDCESRKMKEARAEYHTLTGKGIRAARAGSTVGFDQRNTRFRPWVPEVRVLARHGDPHGPKEKR
jgi:hypothetical protein